MKKTSYRLILLTACALLFLGMAPLPDSREAMGEAAWQETGFSAQYSETQTQAAPETAASTEEPTQAVTTQSEEQPAQEAALYLRANVPLSAELQQYIYALCRENDIRYELVLSIIYQESRFDPQAEYHNTDGTVDRGLMQINSSNNYSPQTLLDPFENTRIGVEVIADKVARYGELYGLMAYKMGDYGMEQAREEGTINTKYADKILVKQTDFR